MRKPPEIPRPDRAPHAPHGAYDAPKRRHSYRALVVARLDAITHHGDPVRYGRTSTSATSGGGYFPTYLLKCLQDHFDRRGDELHDELKHVRNALDVVIGSLRFVEKAAVQSRQIEAMAQAHRFLRANAPAPSDPNQMALF